MAEFWRQVRPILALPVLVTIVIPAALLLLTRRTRFGGRRPSLSQPTPTLAGLMLIGVGLTLVVRTVGLFVRFGQGTLAPWDPPRRLVVRGIYRHVRNPMISGVVCILFGASALLRAPALLLWALLFFTGNSIYLPRFEERHLLDRFGDDYAAYRANVPRWLPRRRPWQPPDENSQER
ncbi:MAG: isoprenylcysteine carboxylmethyltransferase family protein [Chloroflexi bacterium]|nr:isoprenylcysteine carboxylmethyltransferase family protein [Chloroflexota bacterium]